MSGNSHIQWTDRTWNPVVGCSMVSPGCANCYAETMSNRLAAMALADSDAGRNMGRKVHYLKVIKDGRWNGVLELVPEALADPLGWRKPSMVFVNSMSDLFHENVPFEFIDKVFAVMALCPQHTFQVLTKRPERMAEYTYTYATPKRWWQAGVKARLPVRGSVFDLDICSPLPNVWLGCSVEDQQRADERIPHLLKCSAAVRFLSVEPLLGPVDIQAAINRMPWQIGGGDAGLHWVIVGGESGHGACARPCNIEWIRSIVGQCKAAGISCFVKQLGSDPFEAGKCANLCRGMGRGSAVCDCGNMIHGSHFLGLKITDSKGGEIEEFPSDLRVRQFPSLAPPSSAMFVGSLGGQR